MLAILGENGAGKSTLMKIIYGAARPDEGEISFDGHPLGVETPAQARELGIAMVHQHFALFDTLSVTENVALGLSTGISAAEIEREIRLLGEKYGLEVDPASVVMELSMGERQRVEILRALMTKPKLLILDEPTSVLTPQRYASSSRHCISFRARVSPFSLFHISSMKFVSLQTAALCFAQARLWRALIRRLKARKISPAL